MGRWHNNINQNIDRATGRLGRWTAGEESKLQDAVQMHGGKNWAAIAVLIPGRTQKQCARKWHCILDANIDRTPGRLGTRTEDEDIKLKVAVQMYGGNNWDAIAALVPSRTKIQCWSSWL
jgi:hypothetical protein